MADVVKKSGMINADVVFAFFVGGILFVLLFPLPTSILSILLVLNICVALLILMLTFYIKTSLEISSFPTILLVLTLFRLSLNVASTKLILMNADAGSVIDAFGNFVVGNNYIIGAVVFLILVIINFVVIVKGSSRIAEVSARFTLDAMPGKQMSIDSDLNAGLIDEDEAKKKRQELRDEAEFYGSMDGASKFVTGDAMAGIIITAINILGGIGIGVLQRGMPIVDALGTFTILTIGDGLVSQIPALLISVGAGMLVSKTASDDGGTGVQLSRELFRRHQPLIISAIMLMVLGVLPGFPFMPFAILSAACFFGGMASLRKNQAEEALALAEGRVPGELGDGGGRAIGADGAKRLPAGGGGGSAAAELAEPEDNLPPRISPMTLELGFSLVPMVDPNQDADLVDRIAMIRKQIKEEMGFLIPPISIQDNIDLVNNEYRILVRGLERARGVVHPTSHLAINPGDVSGEIEGIRTIDPAFGFAATWINASRVEVAESMGYTVVDASSVVTTHVTKVVKDYAAELLSRQDVSDTLEQLKERNRAVVEELIPGKLPVGVVHRTLQHLLDEKVPIHDLPAILETMSDYAEQTKDPVFLCEFARQALKGHIVAQYIGDDRCLHAMTLDPELEQELQEALNQGGRGGMLNLSPERAVEIAEAIKSAYGELCGQVEADVVLLVSPLIRSHLFRMVARKVENLPVLSYSEVSDDVPLQVLGSVNTNREVAA